MVKNSSSEGSAEAGRSARGRPPKSQQIIDNLVAAYAPETIGKRLFADVDEDGSPIEDASPLAILASVARRAGLMLEEGQRLACAIDKGGGDLSALRPWAYDATPREIIAASERTAHTVDREIAALTSRLAQYLVVRQELRSLGDTARRRAEDELGDIPRGMVIFLERLMATGLTTRDVKNMSKSRLAKVVGLIRGQSAAEIEAQILGDIPYPEVAEEHNENHSDDIDEMAAASHNHVAREPFARGVELPPTSQGEGIDRAQDQAAKADVERNSSGRWDNLDLTGLGYSIEEYPPQTDAERDAANMLMPDVETLMELSTTGPQKVVIAHALDRKRRDLAIKALTMWSRDQDKHLSESQKRIWVFLLVALPSKHEGTIFGEDGYFDGLIMPGRFGSGTIRKLVAIDRSVGALEAALTPAC